DALRARGAEVVSLANARGSVDLAAVLAELGGRGDNELHVEAGRTLSGALLRAGLVDELLVYVAPSLLGADAAAMFELSAPVSLESRVKLRFHDVERVGEDLRILARFEGVS
ncbi:dihydrofolate reductase family protein, partial [Burkholderia sp. Tr-860]